MTAPKGTGLVAARPAESAGIAGAAGLLLARVLGVSDPDTIVAIGAVIGFVPAAVTWLVTTIRSVKK